MQTLYTLADNFRGQKALIAAQFSGAKVKVVSDSTGFVFGETNKSSEFTKKFPLGKVPALETAEGEYIFESSAIAYYLASDDLRGKSNVDKAHVIQWISFAESEILPHACALVFPCLGLIQFNKQANEKAKEEIKRIFAALNQHLLTRTYLVGERVTLADISVATNLVQLYQLVLEPSFRDQFPNVNRWFTTLINQSQFKAVLGDVKLCDKAAQFDAKKYAELQGKPEKSPGKPQKGAGDKAEKKEKPAKKEPEPKEEEVDPMDEILAAEPKTKDPFEVFPKGSFIMDEFKRVYSNESEEVSIKYFWEKFDKENYSIWYGEYKYPEELKLTFMSCNLITGMFQRLDKMRKNAFGSVILFGEDHKSTISGIWFWRGPELAFNLSPDWQVDYESYSWTKLNPDDAKTKKMVNEYFSWAGDFDGKKFTEGKIFK